MKIELAQTTIATKDVQGLTAFYRGLLGESADEEDHDFYAVFTSKSGVGSVAVVPHSGDPKWDHPWLTLGTDDLPAAIAHLKSMGVDSIENSGPTDENGEPAACITFRDPEGRLIMMALLDES